MTISKAGSGSPQSIATLLSQMDVEIAALAEQISTKTGQKVDPEQLVEKLGLSGAPGSFWKSDPEEEKDSGAIVDDDWGALAARISARTGQSFTGADLLERFGKDSASPVAEVERKSGRAGMRNDLEAQMKALRMRSR